MTSYTVSSNGFDIHISVHISIVKKDDEIEVSVSSSKDDATTTATTGTTIDSIHHPVAIPKSTLEAVKDELTAVQRQLVAVSGAYDCIQSRLRCSGTDTEVKLNELRASAGDDEVKLNELRASASNDTSGIKMKEKHKNLLQLLKESYPSNGDNGRNTKQSPWYTSWCNKTSDCVELQHNRKKRPRPMSDQYKHQSTSEIKAVANPASTWYTARKKHRYNDFLE
jgi:hypothetical protein